MTFVLEFPLKIISYKRDAIKRPIYLNPTNLMYYTDYIIKYLNKLFNLLNTFNIFKTLIPNVK